MKFGVWIVCCGALPASLAVSGPVLAQGAPPSLPFGIGDAVRESEESRKPPVPRPAATPVLPQLVEPQLTLADKETLLVRRFTVDGPTLGAESEVRAILAPYEGHKLTIAQIYEAADRITALYRTRGYLVAKAYVPAQDANGGSVRIKLVPGRYGEITTKNESLVRDWFVQRLAANALAKDDLIHKEALERVMLLTSDLPGAGMPRATIGAGRQPETTDLALAVPSGRRVDGYLLGDNYGSPYTGRDRLTGGLNVNSPLGIGDRLALYGILSEGSNLKNGRIAYAFPIGWDGLRAELAAFRTTYALGGTYGVLDATGTADVVTGTLTYAIRRQRQDSIYVSATYTHKSLNDEALGVSTAHRRLDSGTVAISRDTVGALIGLPLTTSTTLSMTAGYVEYPDPAQKAANLAGVDTVGQYARFNLSFAATVAFTNVVSLATQVRVQKSLSGNLDSSEQIGLTGYWGVRSFDEGLAGDTGYLITPELKYALPDAFGIKHSVGVFTDLGGAWIEDASYTVAQQPFTRLQDVGLGYYLTYEYSPGRMLVGKAQLAHTFGSDDGAQSYDRGTKALFQVGVTF